MARILFVCFGNICRSTDMLGTPVYPPARLKLAEHGISYAGKTARQLVKADYSRYDLLIGMDRANLRDMLRICGGDPEDKRHLLMEYTGRSAGGFRPADGFRPGDVAVPWYTGDFKAAWNNVLEGCPRIALKTNEER